MSLISDSSHCLWANFQTRLNPRFLLSYEVSILIILTPHCTLSPYWIMFPGLNASCCFTSRSLHILLPLLESYFPFPPSSLLCWQILISSSLSLMSLLGSILIPSQRLLSALLLGFCSSLLLKLSQSLSLLTCWIHHYNTKSRTQHWSSTIQGPGVYTYNVTIDNIF